MKVSRKPVWSFSTMECRWVKDANLYFKKIFMKPNLRK